MNPEHQYKVYIRDTDGSERLGCTLFAKSEGHAKQRAIAAGIKQVIFAVKTAVTTQTIHKY